MVPTICDQNFECMLPEFRLFVFSTKLPKAPECQNVGRNALFVIK